MRPRWCCMHKDLCFFVRGFLSCSRVNWIALNSPICGEVVASLEGNFNTECINSFDKYYYDFLYSIFLDRVKEAFEKDPDLKSLLMDDYFSKKLAESHLSWRRAIITAINHGCPVPAFSSALAYYDGFRCPLLPANLLQV